MTHSGETHKILEEKWNVLSGFFQNDSTEQLYRYIDKKREFGIARFVADQIQHLPGLLQNSIIKQTSHQTYSIYAEESLGKKKLIFSHPLTAKNEEDAKLIAEGIKSKLVGIRNKMWLACWNYANKVSDTGFSASIVDLMKECYPERTSTFSTKERREFYEELQLLRFGEFTLKWSEGKKGKQISYEYKIPILRVGGAIGEVGKDRDSLNKVYIDLCAITPTPIKETLLYVGAPIKKTIFNLGAGENFLAQFLQVRKNQLDGGDSKKQKTSHSFSIEQIITVAGLNKTYESNPRMGRKRLIDRLGKIVKEGIVSSFEIKKNRKKVFTVTIFW